MGQPIPLRPDYDAAQLRWIARESEDADQVRRLLALAVIYEGGRCTEAAEVGGMTLQVVRDWVLRFNAHGPEGLIDRKAPGQPSRLNDEHRAALVAMVENGPIPAVHEVVRWRIIDLCQWLWEEHQVTVSKHAEPRTASDGLPPVIRAPTSSRASGGCRRGFQNVWPAPSARGSCELALAVCANLSGLEGVAPAKMESRALWSS
jgi:transposase